MSMSPILMLSLLWSLVDGVQWEGYWEGSEYPFLNLRSCLDSSGQWKALVEELDGTAITTLFGSLTSPEKASGTCLPSKVRPVVDFDLIGWNDLRYVYLGSTINFISSAVNGTFNLSVTNSTGGILFEYLNALPGTEIRWQTELHLLESLTWDPWLYVSWGMDIGYVQLELIGTSLSVEVQELQLTVTCYTDYVKWYYSFRPSSSGDVPTICEDYSKLWIGGWRIQTDSPDLGYSWYVCQSSTGGLVSSFADPEFIASSLAVSYKITSSNLSIGPNSLEGIIIDNIFPSYQATFHFDMSDNKTSFLGTLLYEGFSYNVTGQLSSSAPYNYLCSPYDIFAGLWVESQYSSWMVLCVDGNAVTGSYFGGAVLVTGHLYYDGEVYLYGDTFDKRTNETSPLVLTMKKGLTQHPLIRPDFVSDKPFATPEFRIISNCLSVPSTWGIYDDELFSSELYLCTGNNNAVFGSLNNGTYIFTGNLIDINIISGKIINSGLSFNWILDSNTIYAEYKDENGVSISTTMIKKSDDVTLSQCTAIILISAYIGTWRIDNNSGLSFCQVSDSVIEGKMGDYYFYGVFKDGTLTGTYIKGLNSTGNWTAQVDKEEMSLVLTIDDTLIETSRYSRISNTFECGAWRTFWKSSFGHDDTSFLLGGCFSICFKEQVKTEFTIIFFNTEMYGNGTIDTQTGTLSGKLENGWNFSIAILGEDAVFASYQEPNGLNNEVYYTLCSYFPANYSASPTAYPNCLPRRFEPAIHLPSVSYPEGFNFDFFEERQGGVDLTADGKIAIVASFDKTFVLVNSGGTWGNLFPLPDAVSGHIEENYPSYVKTPVAITNTHAFVIYAMKVSVFQNYSEKWEWIGDLDSPCLLCMPYHVIKTFSEGFCVLEVTWRLDIFFISLYNISSGEVDFSPFYTIQDSNEVFAVAIHPSWLVYTSFDATYTMELRVYYCPLSPNGLSACSYLKLATSTSSFGLGFSLAVNRNYLFVGYPSSQNNNGSVYVYKHNNHIWRLSQILYPPDSGLHQSFGRTISVRENNLIILKAQDNTLEPLSLALFAYTLSSNNWVPNFKFISKDWPYLYSPFQKRQFVLTPSLESTLYWSMSNNGTLFVTSPFLETYIQTWYSCPPGYWGIDCSLICPCVLNSTCNSNIIGYTCSCLPNTYGTNCENRCIDCNGAHCDDGATGSGICLCNSSQYGPQCLPCKCLNGICSSGPNGTGLCKCEDGYTGIECAIKLSEVSTTAIVALSVAIPCAVLILVGILLFFLCRRQQSSIDISDLPEELQWYFDTSRIESESDWKEEKGFLMKDVREDKKYLKKLNSLMEFLDGTDIKWKEAYAIYNSTLQNNFLGFRNVTLNRHKDSPILFKKDYVRNERRDWVMEQFHKIVNRYEWNVNLELPILPVIHGTSTTIGKSICSTGFAALSSLDVGFYGKGIYVTSSCLYALPYYAPKPEPAILICLATPGNVSPIIEDTTDTDSWLGKSVPNGFQSHYVITSKDGKILKNMADNFFDEFVLPTESQLVPIYLLTLQSSSLTELLKIYQRAIAE